MFSGIDLCSDTVTKPSIHMKQAMMDARLGDEQQGEDPTTNLLEARMASLLGKSAAMFFPSATMCNQIAIYLHCRAGDEIIGAEQSHIFTSEGGGAAFHARAQARMIPTRDGVFSGSDLKRYLRTVAKPHVPKASLVVVENTMNGGGGSVWPPEKLADVIWCAKEFDLKTHLDGARIFNAAAAVNTPVKTLSENFSTATVCFSKGLGCAMGAVLAFDKEDWVTIRRLKQVFGGAMRQSGMLAAACLYALDHHTESLSRDHAHAARLANLLQDIPGVLVENPSPASNMVFFSVEEGKVNAEDFFEASLNRGVRFSRFAYNRFRAVTHRDVSGDQIEKAGVLVREILTK